MEKQREETERNLGHRQIGVAVCEVLDDLIRRTRTVTAVVPADAPITLSRINNHADDATALMRLVPQTLKSLAQLMGECEEVVYAQRQAFARLIGRIESEGYHVDPDTFTTVTDAGDWSALDVVDDSAVHVQLTAEKIARTEQAAVYQQRLERMDTAIRQIEAGFAQQIRKLTAIQI